MTFNIPIHLKSNFDELSLLKCVSKTSIINSLIEVFSKNDKATVNRLFDQYVSRGQFSIIIIAS